MQYGYDIWGKLLSVTGEFTDTLGIATPLHYRGFYFDNETGYYYLQSRYYDSETCRFLNADKYLKIGNPLDDNAFLYCYNNPIMLIDFNGAMSVPFLRMLSKIYNKNIISSAVASLSSLALNGGGIYTAFHEIAQLNIAKELYKRGYNVTLEYGLGKKGEADIVAQANWYSKKYVWEVKPLGTSASAQISKYTNGTGLKKGFSLGNINNIRIFGNIKMNITFDGNGGAYYAFYLGGQRITNAQFYRAIKYSIYAACAVAATIIVATLVEDIATLGLGLWNDALSFAGAAASMGPILIGGLKLYGYA